MPDPGRSHLTLVGEDDADEFAAGMEAAGRFLSRRPRSEKEVRDRLGSSGYDAEVAERVVARLYELSLLDDEAFARDWIESRVAKKRLGRRALVAELGGKGVDRSVAEAAWEELAPDEDAQAVELASAYLRRVGGHPLTDQARKIAAMLARKGFDHATADAAVRAVLPPEGWD